MSGTDFLTKILHQVCDVYIKLSTKTFHPYNTIASFYNWVSATCLVLMKLSTWFKHFLLFRLATGSTSGSTNGPDVSGAGSSSPVKRSVPASVPVMRKPLHRRKKVSICFILKIIIAKSISPQT